MNRKLSYLFFCVAVGVTSFISLDYWALHNGRPETRLERLWEEDVATLEQSGKLPSFWTNIQKVELYGGDSQAKEWINKISVPIKAGPTGTHKLEVLLLTWNEDGKVGAVIQYNAIDLKTKNMVWELGRTFILR